MNQLDAQGYSSVVRGDGFLLLGRKVDDTLRSNFCPGRPLLTTTQFELQRSKMMGSYLSFLNFPQERAFCVWGVDGLGPFSIHGCSQALAGAMSFKLGIGIDQTLCYNFCP